MAAPASTPNKVNQSDDLTVDANTTLDIYIGPKNTITELADTVDTLDGIRAETIDIRNDKDGTHVEVIAMEEPSDSEPGKDTVDNFVTVDGIGPEVAQLLLNGGIRTFRQLAETPVERIREILDAAGPRFRIHDAAHWPERAGQLAERKSSDQAEDVSLPYGFGQWTTDKKGRNPIA